MHDAAAVRVLERPAQREADPQHVAVAEDALGAELVQRAAMDQLGDQVPGALILAGVEDGDHAGMVEPAGGERLAAAALAVRRRAGDHLHGHGALQALVGRRVDCPEAAGAEPLAEPVPAEDELCGHLRRELVGGLHQARVRRTTAVPSDLPVTLKLPEP